MTTPIKVTAVLPIITTALKMITSGSKKMPQKTAILHGAEDLAKSRKLGRDAYRVAYLNLELLKTKLK